MEASIVDWCVIVCSDSEMLMRRRREDSLMVCAVCGSLVTTTTLCQIITGFYYNYNYTWPGCAVYKFLFLSKYQQSWDWLRLAYNIDIRYCLKCSRERWEWLQWLDDVGWCWGIFALLSDWLTATGPGRESLVTASCGSAAAAVVTARAAEPSREDSLVSPSTPHTPTVSHHPHHHPHPHQLHKVGGSHMVDGCGVWLLQPSPDTT